LDAETAAVNVHVQFDTLATQSGFRMRLELREDFFTQQVCTLAADDVSRVQTKPLCIGTVHEYVSVARVASCEQHGRSRGRRRSLYLDLRHF
jgi:hypothetical protein